MTIPLETAFTTPLLLTVAMLGSLLVQTSLEAEDAGMTVEEVHRELEQIMKELTAKTFVNMILSDMQQTKSTGQTEQSGDRTKQAEDTLKIIKEVQRRKK